MTELHFLGCGAAFYPVFGNTSAWFVRGTHFFLLDCGEDVFRKVYGLDEYRNSDQVTVVLTHMHCDHAGSLGSLLSYTWFCRGIRAKVVYPDERLIQYLTLEGIVREAYEFCPGPCREAGLMIRPVSVHHDPSMGCFGYRLEDEEERLYYSGDSSAVEDSIVEELKNGTLDRLYLDTSKHAPRDSGHGNYEALKEKIGPEWRRRVVCMHLDCDFIEEIKRDGFLCAMNGLTGEWL